MTLRPNYLSFLKALLLLASLLNCATVLADKAEPTQNQPDNIVQSDTSATDEVLNAPDSEPALNTQNTAPNRPVVPMASKFKRIDGSPSIYAQIVAKYCKAAKTGDVDAYYALAWMYENGKGVFADKSIAAQLYTKAAEQSHASAQQSLTRFKDVALTSSLPTCLLTDPPVAKVIAPNVEVAAAADEHKAVSDKTAALFYSQRSIFKIVNKLAPKYKIDANLAMAFIAVESNFNVQATSPKNAQGLMQLIPETAERFGVKDAYKAEENIKGGLAYLRWLLAYYKGDIELVAAAYNAGEGAVDKFKGVPPYPETRMYVKKIANLYNNLTHPYQDNFVKGSRVDSFPKKKVM
jgi:soluble lytic murein transglycosylase-like protein